mmetsp:Transcript_26086/g.64617  ORF Transcript_26086/g.64617 Transcript_26086/m.64617 type:complete len:207 (+) Transcript_26086:224-844(+)
MPKRARKQPGQRTLAMVGSTGPSSAFHLEMAPLPVRARTSDGPEVRCAMHASKEPAGAGGAAAGVPLQLPTLHPCAGSSVESLPSTIHSDEAAFVPCDDLNGASHSAGLPALTVGLRSSRCSLDAAATPATGHGLHGLPSGGIEKVPMQSRTVYGSSAPSSTVGGTPGRSFTSAIASAPEGSSAKACEQRSSGGSAALIASEHCGS